MEEIRYLHNLLQRVHLIQVYSYKFCIYEWYLIVCIDHVVVMPDPVPYLSIYTFESLFILRPHLKQEPDLSPQTEVHYSYKYTFFQCILQSVPALTS